MQTAWLLVVRGPETGLRFELQSGRLRLGSDDNADIVLQGTGVAKQHAQIHGDASGFTLFAPGSETAVNGVPATQTQLHDGDRLRLGEVELLFRHQAPEQKEEQPQGHSLIAACSLFYLFRAMHGLDLDEQTPLEAQVRNIASAELGPGQLDIFIGGTLADWAKRLSARQRAEGPWEETLRAALEHGLARHPEGALVQAFRFAPASEVCLVWHAEDPTSESAFSALAAIASAALETASEISNLEIRSTLAEEEITSRTGILGSSPATLTLLRQIEKVAPRETTVLIQGESGTGKELVARALHRLSPRHNRPFVALNCAAIADTLLESELFGHEKGAFTGATEQRPGKLELAAGGTVFLDEIGEMALPLQAKMLRVLQQRECERVGGRKTIPLDIRVVAATNRDLAAEVKKGSFREDLFHRLNVVGLRTPPLRERGDDIELLARAFLQRASAAAGRHVGAFTPAALSALRRYDWPGNIRELENTIERAVVLGDLPEVQLEDLPDCILDSTPAGSSEDSPAFHRSIHDAKRGAIIDAWRRAGGEYKDAAAILGVHPNSLLRMIRNLGLRAELGA
jgi:DNA-binding NtrC family response regulator